MSQFQYRKENQTLFSISYLNLLNKGNDTLSTGIITHIIVALILLVC